MNLAAPRRFAPAVLLAAALAALPMPAAAAGKRQINGQELTLPNGMRWLLFERHSSPTVVGGWVAHVGSVNEREGITGISHLFEHMMFKGTRTIGTTNIDADLRIIDEQEKVRSEMREEMKVMRDRLRKGEIDDLSKPENQTPRYRELEKRFDELVLKQRETLVKDQLSLIYTKNGGEGLNAFTDEDKTVYFGRIPRGKTEPPEVLTTEPPQPGEKRFNAEAETSPTVRIWWHAVAFPNKDRTVLDLVSDVMSGRTGRLYKGLVTGRQVANQTSAVVDLKKYEGAFQVECTVKDGKDPAAVEQAVYEELEKLKSEPLGAEELQKVKNEAKANAYRRLSSPFYIALQLLVYDGLGDWHYINTYAEEVDRVTAADIQRVARQHFTKENRTVGIFLRKEGAAPADAELAALPAQAQAMARQQIERIQAETDQAKLRAGIAQMEQAKGQVPAEMKPVFDLILKRAHERLAALEGE